MSHTSACPTVREFTRAFCGPATACQIEQRFAPFATKSQRVPRISPDPGHSRLTPRSLCPRSKSLFLPRYSDINYPSSTANGTFDSIMTQARSQTVLHLMKHQNHSLAYFFINYIEILIYKKINLYIAFYGNSCRKIIVKTVLWIV